MSFWKSKGSIISACCAVSLVLGAAGGMRDLSAASSGESKGGDFTQEGTTQELSVTLAGITSFQDSQEIRAGLLKTEGVKKVMVDAEAPGLLTYKVTYAGEAMSLIDKLSNFFPKKYDFREKRLPGGGTEVSISRK